MQSEHDILGYEHFQHVLRSLGAKLYHAAAIHTALTKAWQGPQRVFHTTAYLKDCLFHLEQERWGGLIETCDRGRLSLALWFHDAVYDVKASDNEDKSAAWAVQSLALLDVQPQDIECIRQLILSTRPGFTATGKPLESWMHDIHLHILGADPIRFAQYTKDIRQEFSWVDDLNYRRGLDLVMRRFTSNPKGIYQTEAGRIDYEEAAKKNLELHIEGLLRLQLVLQTPTEYLNHEI